MAGEMTVWPTDAVTDGPITTEAQWRKPARLWAPTGFRVGELTPTFVAGTPKKITVAPGGAWLDGHYVELASSATVDVVDNGILVLRYTAADGRCELLFRSGAAPGPRPLSPTKTLAVYEVIVATMNIGVFSDSRQFIRYGSGFAKPTFWAQYSAINVFYTGGGVVNVLPMDNTMIIESIDTHAMHSMLANTNRITVPFRGLYHVTGYVALKSAVGSLGTYHYFAIRNQNSAVLAASRHKPCGSSAVPIQTEMKCCVDWPMSVGDWFEFVVASDSTGPTMEESRFSVTFEGPVG